jgi:hypothetical protein
MSAVLPLPGAPGAFAAAVAAAIQVPAEMPALLTLGALSVATRGRWCVEAGDWSEPLALRVVALAESGARKTAVMTQITAPLESWERRHADESPTWFTDFTRQALSAAGGPRALVSDSGSLWDLVGQRAFGDLLRERAAPGATARFFAVLGADVPVFAQEARRHGLLEQLLVVLPETDLLGMAYGGRIGPSIPADVKAAWGRAVQGILDASLTARGVVTLGVEPDGLVALSALRTEIARDAGPSGSLADIAGWAMRLPGQLVRIAALLALAEDPGRAEVGAEHVRAAIGMAEALVAHARLALGGEVASW